MAEPLEVIMRLILRHDALINVLAQGFAEHANLILQGREQCGRCNKNAATLRHLTLGVHYCDQCAARIIMKARDNLGRDADLDMNTLRAMVSDDDAWLDLPGALGVRRAQDLVMMTSHNLDEPDVPERGSLEWQ
jgi:DNA-directed RNA polymerase subunit RPC12/RpoP